MRFFFYNNNDILSHHSLCRGIFWLLLVSNLPFQLLTASVQEDGYELSLTLTFALRGGKDKFAGKKLGITGDYLSLYTEQDNQTTYRSDSDGKKNL